MSARIEPTLIVTDGARVAADGHLRLRVPPTVGPVVPIQITEGSYTRLDDLCVQIQVDIIAAMGAGWTCTAPAVGDSVTIAGPGAFDLKFQDDELAQHLGFDASVLYPNAASHSSALPTVGRITLENPLDFAWGTRLFRRSTSSHKGEVSAALLGLTGVATYTALIMDTEIGAFAGVALRILAGVPVRISLDRTVVSDWALTAADWKGGRLMVVANPGADMDLGQFLAPPAATIRRVSMMLIDCEV